MIKPFKSLEMIVNNSIFRFLTFATTFISAVIVIITHNYLWTKLLVFSVGLLTLSENINPSGIWMFYPSIFPNKIQKPFSIVLRVFLSIIGIYLMLLMSLAAFYDLF